MAIWRPCYCAQRGRASGSAGIIGHMNPLLEKLQPYPFERLRQLFAGITPDAKYRPISLGIGEPKHPTPQFIKDALVAGLDGLANYPITAVEPHLREAFRKWLATRGGRGAGGAGARGL